MDRSREALDDADTLRAVGDSAARARKGSRALTGEAASKTTLPAMPSNRQTLPDLATHAGLLGSPRLRLFLGWGLLLLYVFALQGSRSLWQPDEGRYVSVALRMLRTGDYLTPYLNDETLHLTKPPLTYWVLAAGMRLLGTNEWAVRLPWALAYLGTIWMVHGMARRLLPSAAALPALVYATCFLPYIAANVLTTDTLLALCEASAAYGFVRLWWDDGGHPERWRCWLWASFGLAFLTKGPPGLMPLLGMLLFANLDARRPLRQLVSFASLGAFAVLGLGWFVVLFWRLPGAASYFLKFEVYDRLFSSVHDRSPQWYGPFKVYGPALLLGSLPWTPVLFRAVWEWGARLRRGGRRELRSCSPETLLLVLWIALPLALLAVARSRLPLYVLPLFVPLALLVGRRLGPDLLWTRGRRVALAGWMIGLVALRAGLALMPSHKDTEDLARYLTSHVSLPFDEVVFVSATPYYGLSFYLPVEVEFVYLHPDTGTAQPISPPESLLQELAVPERRLFAVPDYHLASFEEYVGQHDLEFEVLGQWYEFTLIRLEARLGSQ